MGTEPKPRNYRITYHGPDNRIFGTFEFKTSILPSHVEITIMLESELPDRPRGGWYEMETVVDNNAGSTSKIMPCGHYWSDYVSCDTVGGTFMCGICSPIGMKVALLKTVKDATEKYCYRIQKQDAGEEPIPQLMEEWHVLINAIAAYHQGMGGIENVDLDLPHLPQ